MTTRTGQIGALRTLVGTGLVIAGAVALVLPVPALPLLIAGAAVLGRDHPLVRRVGPRLPRWRIGRRA